MCLHILDLAERQIKERQHQASKLEEKFLRLLEESGTQVRVTWLPYTKCLNILDLSKNMAARGMWLAIPYYIEFVNRSI